jgi:hypothetical protein
MTCTECHFKPADYVCPDCNKKMIFVGCTEDERQVFEADETPTLETYPKFNAVIGPFETWRGAEFMAFHGKGNPHCSCVADAEQLAITTARITDEEAQRLYSDQSDAISINDKGEAFYCGRAIIDAAPEENNPNYMGIRRWMDAHEYYPDVWEYNDHGNATLLSINIKGETTIHAEIV